MNLTLSNNLAHVNMSAYDDQYDDQTCDDVDCFWPPYRLVSLRLSTRHQFRGPASLFTGKEAEFTNVGLFSTNE